MKILICYYSKTGNTELIAKNMYEALKDHEVSIKPIQDVKYDELNNYDIVFLGSGIYAGGVGKEINKLIKESSNLPKKFVLFYTHANPDPKFYKKAFNKVRRELEKREIEIIGEFDCIGENKDEKVVEILLKTQPSLKEAILSAKGRPNQMDFENAKTFARKIITKLV